MYINERSARQAREAIASTTVTKERVQKSSLDLRIAAQAIYSSPALEIVEQLPESNGVKRQVVQFQVDGLREYAFVTLPNTPIPEDGYPTVILLHGYVKPSAYNNTTAYFGDMQFLSQAGYAVVKPDLRGNGSSQGLAEGAYYSIGYHNDIMTLIDAMKKTDYLDTSSMAVWGHSMGGYLALRTAVMSADIKNVVILAGAVGSAESMYKSYSAPSDRLNKVAREYRFEALRIHGDPEDNPEFWHNASPYSRLKDTKATFQIHVGLRDQVVPPSFSAELAQALQREAVSYEYFAYPTGTHGLLAERSVINERILKLFMK